MGSIGWYILGYFGLGIICLLTGSVGIVIIAAIHDIRWDMKHDKSMERADTLDALQDAATSATEVFNDQCQMTDDPQGTYMLQTLKTLALWPYMIPKGLTIMWRTMIDLRDERRR